MDPSKHPIHSASAKAVGRDRKLFKLHPLLSFLLQPPTMRPPATLAALLRARPAIRRVAPAFARPSSSAPHQESFESFTERYDQFFQQAQDLFEVQRGLNNCFSHDLVPAPSVVEAALRAARRVDDYATAVRVFEGVREKVENKQQYQAYLEELKGVREELGTSFQRLKSRDT